MLSRLLALVLAVAVTLAGWLAPLGPLTSAGPAKAAPSHPGYAARAAIRNRKAAARDRNRTRTMRKRRGVRKRATVTSRRAGTRKTASRARSKRRAKRRARPVAKRSRRRVAARSARSDRRARRTRFRKGAVARRVVAPAARKAVDRGPVRPELLLVTAQAVEEGRIVSRQPWDCLPDHLKAVLGQVVEKWGPVTVNSTHRSRRHNRRVGGRSRSYHLRCQAVDFRVNAPTPGMVAWLRDHPMIGGYKKYPSGYVHIDVGPRRTW